MNTFEIFTAIVLRLSITSLITSSQNQTLQAALQI